MGLLSAAELAAKISTSSFVSKKAEYLDSISIHTVEPNILFTNVAEGSTLDVPSGPVLIATAQGNVLRFYNHTPAQVHGPAQVSALEGPRTLLPSRLSVSIKQMKGSVYKAASFVFIVLLTVLAMVGVMANNPIMAIPATLVLGGLLLMICTVGLAIILLDTWANTRPQAQYVSFEQT